MARVLFTDTDEFLEELERDARAGAIQDRIVRVTQRHKHADLATTHLSVVATYVARSQVVTLERHMGTLWGRGFEDKDMPILEKAEQLVNMIISAAEELGLDVRPGVIVPD
jgi:hypothetical protein